MGLKNHDTVSLRVGGASSSDSNLPKQVEIIENPPKSVDWRKEGKVSIVKN